MCWNEQELVPIPDLLWQAGAIHDFDRTHPEYGINEQGERCLVLDRCIVPAIKALWFVGVVTISCCCLHGMGFGSITLQKVAVDPALLDEAARRADEAQICASTPGPGSE